jgi:hypothetical protein
MFPGTFRRGEVCQPAPSSTSTAMAPTETCRLISARCSFMASILTSGMMIAAPVLRSGQTAPNDSPFIAPVARGARARATFGPHPSDGSLLTDASFIGEPYFHRSASRLRGQRGGYEISKPTLKTACASGSLSGCCGRTEIRRNDNLRNSLPTVRSCSSTANSSRIRVCRSVHRQRTTPSRSRSGPSRSAPAVLPTAAAAARCGGADCTTHSAQTHCTGAPNRTASGAPCRTPRPPPRATNPPAKT